MAEMADETTPEDEPRLFTVDEANALLDHVRQAMGLVQEDKREFDRLSAEILAMEQKGGSNGNTSPISEIEVLRGKALLVRARVEAKLSGLRTIGVEVKGIDQGLVDFPSLRDGRVVYLCWQVGEDRVEWWHELDGGFAGRRLL
jgi:hypothetical protein